MSLEDEFLDLINEILEESLNNLTYIKEDFYTKYNADGTI